MIGLRKTSSDEATRGAARVLVLTERPREARPLLDEALALDPENASARDLRARALWALQGPSADP